MNDVGSVCQIHVYQAARRRVDVLRKLTADVPATVQYCVGPRVSISAVRATLCECDCVSCDCV